MSDNSKSIPASFVSEKASIISPQSIMMGKEVEIWDYAVLGQKNYYDPFTDELDRVVHLGDRVIIYPMAVIFEGATLEHDVIMEERTSVGSMTKIGARTRILYQSQINDHIKIGEDCVVGGFIADNTIIGKGCSIFGSLIHRYGSKDPKRWNIEDEPGPTLGDNVVVGWHSILIGPVHIGSNAFIYPNAIITEDVPEGQTAYGRRK